MDAQRFGRTTRDAVIRFQRQHNQRATGEVEESMRLQEALDMLRAEVQRRQARIAPSPKRRGRRRRRRGQQTQDNEAVNEADAALVMPRVLREQTSVQYTDPTEVRYEVDLIMAWLRRQDNSPEDRSILQMELETLAPSLQESREQQAAERREQTIQQALTPQVSGDARNQLIETVRLIEGIRPHPDNPEFSYLMFGDEMIILHSDEAQAIRDGIRRMMDRAARRIESVKEQAFDTWSFQAEVDREHRFASWTVSLFTGTDSSDIYDRMSPHLGAASTSLSRYQAMRNQGKLVEMAEAISSAEESAVKAKLIAKQWVGEVISTGENVVRGLEITRDLSFAISTSYFGGAGFMALRAGGMGVARAGLTVTALGTGGTAVARGGSNLAGQALTGDVNITEVGRETAAGARQGLVNTTTGVVTAGTAGALGQGTTFTGRALRTGTAGSAGGATGAGTEAILEGKSAGEVVERTGVGAVSGFAGGLFGGSNLPGQIGLRQKAVGSVLDAAGGAAGAYVSGGSHEDAMRAAGISVLMGRATSSASPPKPRQTPPLETTRQQKTPTAPSTEVSTRTQVAPTTRVTPPPSGRAEVIPITRAQPRGESFPGLKPGRERDVTPISAARRAKHQSKSQPAEATEQQQIEPVRLAAGAEGTPVQTPARPTETVGISTPQQSVAMASGSGTGQPPMPVTKLPPGLRPRPEPMAIKEQPLPEGTHELRRTTKPRLRETTHEEALRASLERDERVLMPPGHDAHHIAPKAGGGKRGDIARDIMRTAGVGIDEGANGVPLPSTTLDPGTIPAAATRHGPIHTERYYREVALRLRKVAGDPVAIRDELRAIRSEIVNGVFPF
jgi:hypothetical protein